jgi:hypothetical protein
MKNSLSVSVMEFQFREFLRGVCNLLGSGIIEMWRLLWQSACEIDFQEKLRVDGPLCKL